MPKYNLTSAQREALKDKYSVFANPQTLSVGNAEITGGYTTTTNVFLDETDATLESVAPCWSPVIYSGTVTATTTADDVTVTIPWYDGGQTIELKNTDTTNFVTVKFNATSSTGLVLGKGETYKLTLPARFVKTIYFTADTASVAVSVLVTAAVPAK